MQHMVSIKMHYMGALCSRLLSSKTKCDSMQNYEMQEKMVSNTSQPGVMSFGDVCTRHAASSDCTELE